MRHPAAATLEEWISTKNSSDNELLTGPKWHVPSDNEVQFANELLNLHFQSALDDLLRICKTKLHSVPGNVHTHFFNVDRWVSWCVLV